MPLFLLSVLLIKTNVIKHCKILADVHIAQVTIVK
jgi:hypothetical protein